MMNFKIIKSAKISVKLTINICFYVFVTTAGFKCFIYMELNTIFIVKATSSLRYKNYNNE
jgi:predicted signal transduction protein with EAL and GGDEF domain